MNEIIEIMLEIEEPISLELIPDPGYVIVPSYVPAAEPLFVGSEAFKFKPGDKSILEEMNNLPNMVLLFENNLI